EPGRIADGRGATPLAGTARLHPLLSELAQAANRQPVRQTGPRMVRTVTQNHAILNQAPNTPGRQKLEEILQKFPFSTSHIVTKFRLTFIEDFSEGSERPPAPTIH